MKMLRKKAPSFSFITVSRLRICTDVAVEELDIHQKFSFYGKKLYKNLFNTFFFS